MRHFLPAIPIAFAAACGMAEDELPRGQFWSGGVIDAGGTVAEEGTNTTGQGAGTGAPTGLPCDVQQLLENRCLACHLGAGAPALLTYEDLVKPAPSDATKSLAQMSLARMKDAARRMPPAPATPAAAPEIAILERWIMQGTPRGESCTTGASSPAPGANPYDTPLKCTSGQTWTRGDEGSSRMHPGRACIACHTLRGKKAFTVAGSVYPSAHEPDDCNGVSSGLTVVVTDANGTVVRLPVNTAGNFELDAETTIVPPFRVKVTDGTKERVMSGTLTAGDCNSCHTASGANGAPGRVMAP